MKLILAMLCATWSATAVAATPAVVGDGACPRYAVDIEAFATCDGDRVAMAEGARLTAEVMLAEDAVPEHKRTFAALYVDAARAYLLKNMYPDDVLLVDIRSGVELSLTGHAVAIDLNVPLRDFAQPLEWDAQASAWRMTANPQFAAQLDRRLRARGATHDSIVMLICRSGDRSARAADELSQLGYRRVVSVVDGYEGDVGPDGRRALNGWKNAGLPWTARVDPVLISGAR